MQGRDDPLGTSLDPLNLATWNWEEQAKAAAQYSISPRPHGFKEFMDWKSPAITIFQYIYFHKGMAIPDIKRIMFFNSQHAVMGNLQACIDWALVI
jgi:hypothetical protein